MKWFVKYFFFCLIALSSIGQTKEVVLNQNWTFSQKGKNKWYAAHVPGTIHTDLLAAKLIPDPFYGNNESKLQWIENEDWQYKTTFQISKNDLKTQKIELQFDGLDTYAEVVFNGKTILFSDNMFRTYSVDVKNILKTGVNTLQINFESAIKKGKYLASQLTYTLPGDEKVFTRKAQHQYGWDWGPRFVTCGIYKNVKLRFLNTAIIKNMYYKVDAIYDSIANLTFECDVDVYKEGVYDLVITNNTDKENKIAVPEFQKNRLLKPGIVHYKIPLNIIEPKRWWCNGLGEAFLYNFSFTLAKKSGAVDTKTINIGVRTIELVREKDQTGESFYFKLNGKPVFIKGANYIPSDNFLPRMQENEIISDVLLAKNANMNMLRVWGGGNYADDAFYNSCDENGILIWQDFMFACAMYPGDSAFINNVRAEATQQIIRLRTHPCIALWCGNNENDEGWKNWGWQKQYHYSKSDSSKIWNDYLKLFDDVLPTVVNTLSPKTNYVGSSPKIGWGHAESLKEGDSHYWGVWWGNEPFETYEKKIGRFMSEYGFQSMPDISTIKKFTPSNELNFNSSSIKNHQKHPTGYATIANYMKRDFIVPDEFEKYIYVSQLLQARGMQIAVEAHHRHKPYCMGTLVWQLNDCWPVTSWSSYDYYKKPKALYYELKKLYAQVSIIIYATEQNDYKALLLNDKSEPIDGNFEICLKDFYGKIILKKTSEVSLAAGEHGVFGMISKTDMADNNLKQIYIEAIYTDKDKSEIRKQYYFVSPKDLQLPKPQLEWNYDEKSQILSLKSKVLVKNLRLNNEFKYLDDNYFDLSPNEEKRIKAVFMSKNKETLTFLSVYDIHAAK